MASVRRAKENQTSNAQDQSGIELHLRLGIVLKLPLKKKNILGYEGRWGELDLARVGTGSNARGR